METSRHDKHPRQTRKWLNVSYGVWATVGDHTYGTPEVLEPRAASLTIGKYCSIADHVIIIMNNHKVNNITSYPFYSLDFIWPEASNYGPDHESPGPIIIGNDVWIGVNAVILPGCSIGNGAVIAAGTVVTRNVPAYSIVAGIPAVVRKYRFTKQEIESLEQIQWWNWSDDQVATRMPDIMSSEIGDFIEKYFIKPNKSDY